MSNKGIKKILAVALLSTLGLVACDKEVQAQPSDYKEPLITFTDEKDEVYHNLVSIIEDAYRDGSLSSAVLDKILYVYANSVFGTYNRVVTPAPEGDAVTLKEAARSAKSADKTIADKFLESHKAYWSLDKDGNRTKDDREYKRITAKWDSIEDRIARTFYDNISGGSYSTRGYFSEKEYLKSLRNDLKKVANPYEDSTPLTLEEDKVVITPEVRKEEVFTKAVDTAKTDEDSGEIIKKTYLHRENYQENGLLEQDESANTTGINYVEKELIPTIYRSLLVEQYLLDESYNNLGRSAARKVNVLTISENSNNDKAAIYLMKHFVKEVLSVQNADIGLAQFNEVGNAMKGLVDSTGKNAYLDTLNAATGYTNAFPKETFEGYDGKTYSYYVGTEYGDMMANFAKIKSDINLTDASVESDFTGSYAYLATVGKEIKENELKAKSYTTDGWVSETYGLSDLPDTIKSRLFNIGVANVLDNDDVKDRFETATYTVPEKESKLVAKINGKYYLKNGKSETGADPKEDILFNESGKYYIIQIEEAISNSKLAKDSDLYEKDEQNPDRKEEIINEVARIVASKDTYQTLSTKHWLEKAAIKYHDTVVYDYFKENYPDLF